MSSEQIIDENEALSAIYSTDFTSKSNGFQISIPIEDSESEDFTPPIATLTISIKYDPETYPLTCPTEITCTLGSISSSWPFSLSPSQFTLDLQHILLTTCENDLANSVVGYELVQRSQSFIRDLFSRLERRSEKPINNNINVKPSNVNKKSLAPISVPISIAVPSHSSSSSSNNNHNPSSSSSSSSPTKKKLKGADKIFNRIAWDWNSVPKSDFVIGYLDRFDGVLEVEFDQFEVAEIPMHRIRFFKFRGQVVWDRENRIDLLTGGNLKSLGIELSDDEAESSGSDGEEKATVPLQNLYTPEDYLEKFCIGYCAQRQANASHYSARTNLYYHLKKEDSSEFMRYWSLSVKDARITPFFIEEIKGAKYHLYIDFEFAFLQSPENMNYSWLGFVANHIASFFPSASGSNMIVTSTHGVNNDASSCKYKHSVRVYVPKVLVDEEVHLKFLRSLKTHMNSCASLSSVMFLIHQNWKEIVDEGIVKNHRVRLFGTTLFKGGKNLKGIHSLNSVWIVGAGKKNEEEAKRLEGNMEELLEMLRVSE